jgi:hypothetical protein
LKCSWGGSGEIAAFLPRALITVGLKIRHPDPEKVEAKLPGKLRTRVFKNETYFLDLDTSAAGEVHVQGCRHSQSPAERERPAEEAEDGSARHPETLDVHHEEEEAAEMVRRRVGLRGTHDPPDPGTVRQAYLAT